MFRYIRYEKLPILLVGEFTTSGQTFPLGGVSERRPQLPGDRFVETNGSRLANSNEICFTDENSCG